MSSFTITTPLRYAHWFLLLGLLAIVGHAGMAFIEPVQQASDGKMPINWVATSFFLLLDIAFWGLFWVAIARLTANKSAAREAFFISLGLVLVLKGLTIFTDLPISWQTFFYMLEAIPVGIFCWKTQGANNRKAIWMLTAMTAVLLLAYISQGGYRVGTAISNLMRMFDIDDFGLITLSSEGSSRRVFSITSRLYLPFMFAMKYCLIASWMQKIANGRSLWSSRRLDLSVDYSKGSATLIFYTFRYMMYCLAMAIPATLVLLVDSRFIPEMYRMSVPVILLMLICTLLALFFVAQYLRLFLLEYFIQRGYPRPNASVFFLSIPILDFLLWPFIALPVAPAAAPEKRLSAFTTFQNSDGPIGLKIVILILNAIFLFFSFHSSSNDDLMFAVIGFALTCFYLFHPAGLTVFIVIQLLFTGVLAYLMVKNGHNGGEVNYVRHIIQGLLTMVYAFIMFGILHPRQMEAELELEEDEPVEESEA